MSASVLDHPDTNPGIPAQEPEINVQVGLPPVPISTAQAAGLVRLLERVLMLEGTRDRHKIVRQIRDHDFFGMTAEKAIETRRDLEARLDRVRRYPR